MPAAAASAAAPARVPLQPHAVPDDSVARNLGQGGRSVNDLHRLLVKNSSTITRRQNETRKLTGK